MSKQITLENIQKFSVPLSEHPLYWKFSMDNESLSEEYKDQIIPLNTKASIFLRAFKQTQKQLSSTSALEKYYKNIEELALEDSTEQEVKKWLYNRGISFDQKVFWFTDSQYGFVITWKMLIKFSNSLFFGSDEFIWDKTLNWALIFDHENVFVFGKYRRK